jgi:flagellar basal-body rod protein FlgB
MRSASTDRSISSRRIGFALEECSVLDDIASMTLQTAIAGLGQRQRVTANNIANSETPGFTASSVDFESALASAVAGGGDPSQSAIAVTPTTDPAGVNGNNVSLEDQFVTATKTTLQEQLLTGTLTAKFNWLSSVLRG